MKIRASIGTLIALGLERGTIAERAYPTTAYLLQYSERGCLASCLFCTQSVESNVRRDFLSRIIWPPIELDMLVDALTKRPVFKRVCFQTVIKKNFIREAINAIERLSHIGIPLSLCITPVISYYLEVFKKKGVEHIGVGLDAITPQVFKVMRKPYTWSIYLKFISNAVRIFGRGKVDVHVIIGLGEDVKEAIKIMKHLYDLGARVALFAYTPFRGVPYRGSRPDIRVYRLFQIVNYLLKKGINPLEYIVDDPHLCVKLKRKILDEFSEEELKEALLTSGCPECNRPYYNESPKGPLYNYPSKDIVNKYWSLELKILDEIFI